MRFVLILFLLSLCSCNNDNLTTEIFSEKLPEKTQDLENLLLDSKDNVEKLEIRYQLYKKYRESSQLKAFDHLNSMINEAEEFDNSYYLGKAYFGRGYIHDANGEYVKSVQSYLKAIDHFNKVNEQSLVSSVLNNLGLVFMETANYEYAKRFFEKTQPFYTEIKDYQRLVLVNINLGICNYSQSNPDFLSAQKCFDEAEKYVTLTDRNENKLLNKIYNERGTMYHAQKDFNQAKNNFLKSLEYAEIVETANRLVFIAYYNIAEAAIGLDDTQEALHWINKAQSIFDSGKLSSKLIVGSYNIRAKLYQAEEDHLSAIQYLDEAMLKADKNVINPTLQETLSLIRVSYKNLETPVSRTKYDNVLEIDGRQDLLEKELVEKTNFEALQAALGKTIELDQARKDILAEVAARELMSKLAFALGMLMMIAAGVIIWYTQKHRKAQQRVDYLEERDNEFLQEVHTLLRYLKG